MYVRLICADGHRMSVSKEVIKEMSLFRKSPDLVKSGSYKLKCSASLELVNTLVERLYDKSSTVEFTKSTAKSMRELCKELGFHGFDAELGETKPTENELDILKRTMLTMQQHLHRNDVLIAELQREISSLRADKKTTSKKIESLEKQVKEIASTPKQDKVAEIETLGKELQKTRTEVKELRKTRSELKALQKKTTELKSLTSDLNRLKESEKRFDAEIKAMPKRVFTLNKREPLSGIIAYLTLKCRGNVHEKEVVTITSSGVYGDEFSPKNAASLGTDSYFWSDAKPGSSICLDFKNRRVVVTGYSIRSCWDPKGGRHLKSWVLEGSTNGRMWHDIDRRENEKELNGEGATGTFPASSVRKERFKYVQLRQTDHNQRGDDFLTLSSLEIFGVLYES